MFTENNKNMQYIFILFFFGEDDLLTCEIFLTKLCLQLKKKKRPISHS